MTTDDFLQPKNIDVRIEGNVRDVYVAGRDILIVPPHPIQSSTPSPNTNKEYIERPLDASLREAILRRDQVAISGMPGVGKTEMAIRLAMSLKDQFTEGVLWVDFGKKTTKEILLETMTSLRIPIEPNASVNVMANQIRAVLSEGERLLIYDNVQDTHIPQFKELFRPPATCALLITTRDSRIQSSLPVGALREVGVFTPKEAVAMLERLLESSGSINRPEALETLSRLCGYHPLALNVSARRILGFKGNQTIESYISELGTKRDSLLEVIRLTPEEFPPEDLDILAVMRVSYDSLPEEEKKFYSYLGVFAGSNFSLFSIINVWWPEIIRTQDESVWMEKYNRGKAIIEDLSARCMLYDIGDSRYQLHDLWRSFALHQLAKDPDQEHDVRHTHAFLYRVYAGMHRERDQVAELAPEYAELTAAMQWAQAVGDSEMLIHLAYDTANMFEMTGRWPEGQTWLNAAIESCGSSSEEDTQRTAHLEVALSHFLFRSGDFPKAEELCRSALATYKKLEDREGEAAMLATLADYEMMRGNDSEAEQILVRAIDTMKEMGEQRQEAVMLGSLSDLLLRRKDIAEAERIQRRSLALLKAIGDRYSSTVAQAKLAYILSGRGELQEAELLMRGAVERMAVLGDRHQAASMQRELALIVFRQHDKVTAEQLLRETVTILREYSEKDPRGLAETLCDLAMFLIGSNRQDEAGPCFLEALQLYRRIGAWHDIEKVEGLINLHLGSFQQEKKERKE